MERPGGGAQGPGSRHRIRPGCPGPGEDHVLPLPGAGALRRYPHPGSLTAIPGSPRPGHRQRSALRCTQVPFPEPQETFLRFVGSIAPSGHLVQELVAAARLLATARARMARYIIIDSPGWVVGPAAVEFQVRMIDLLSPDRVVAIRRGPELGGDPGELPAPARDDHSPVLSPSGGPGTDTGMAVAVSDRAVQGVTSRNHQKPQSALQVSGCMAGSRNGSSDDDWRGLLLALCDHGMMVIALAVVERVDCVHHTVCIRTPAQDPGGIGIDPPRAPCTWIRKPAGPQGGPGMHEMPPVSREFALRSGLPGSSQGCS